MSTLPDDLRARIVARQHTVTRAELNAAGVSATDVSRWRSCGVIVEIAPGVFAVGDALRHQPFLTRAAALSIADADATCDALTSARVWQFPGIFTPTRPGVVSASTLPRSHVIERPDGIRVMSPAATWLGLAALLRPEHYERWSDTLVPDRIGVRAAHAAIRRSGDHRRRPDLRAMRIMSTRRSWQRPHHSEYERRVRSSLRRRGLVGLDGAHTIELPSGICIHPAVVDHECRWAVEVDHRGWHGGRWSQRTHRWIDHQLTQLGWTLVRITDRQLDRHAAATMTNVAASHPRTAALAA